MLRERLARRRIGKEEGFSWRGEEVSSIEGFSDAVFAFAVTLLSGLAVMFGAHRFVAAYLLSVWFIIALGVAFSLHHHARITSYTWAQVLAWLGGAALWIAVTFIAWLVRGREDRPEPFTEMPGDTSRQKLTRPLIMFAVIRAVAIAGAVAIAFGLDLAHGYWMPIAAIVAIKPSFEQTTLVAAQRVSGALIGAAAAVLVLLIPANEHGLTTVLSPSSSSTTKVKRNFKGYT